LEVPKLAIKKKMRNHHHLHLLHHHLLAILIQAVHPHQVQIQAVHLTQKVEKKMDCNKKNLHHHHHHLQAVMMRTDLLPIN